MMDVLITLMYFVAGILWCDCMNKLHLHVECVKEE